MKNCSRKTLLTLYYELDEDFITPEILYAIADYLSQPVAKDNKK